ncbi:Chs5p-Arf1p-binding proteins-domain-containing protein [Cladochytrium replicatum]|nr:Chs5p-Arf1p-binding proteins-domain-containing protein [Cladochytrium replicatum]
MVAPADTSVLRGIPEFFENDISECLAARTESLATFRELGPPDLCHVLKVNPKAPVKEIGTYHYVLGTDASSSATLAAYLNSLTYTIEESQGWVGGKPQWKIKSGTYCCFNAFSRVDVRVEVKIPGGVDSYIVDLRGDRHPIQNPAIWQETYVSAVLRSILDDNDEPDGNDGQPLLGLRKMDPLPTPQIEARFLEAARDQFWKGWQLGTEPEVQVATYFSNHLSNGTMKYFAESGRMEEAARFFDPLFKRDPEVGAVLARAYLNNDEEIQAVKVLHDSLKRQPLSYGLLLVQIDFLRNKKKYEMALKLAKLAVTYAPSEYATWAKLTEIYIDMGDYESALLSLNSCPMFTYCERDAHRMPPPARTHLPLKPDPSTLKPEEDLKKLPPGNGTVFDENDPRENEVHPELQRLPALSLRGTFCRAYALLIRIVSKVGWDELLRFRSSVFVMEEEYRIHRALVEEREKTGIAEERATDEESSSKSQAIKEPNGASPSRAEVSDGDATGSLDQVSLDSPSSGKLKEPAVASPGQKRLSIDNLMKKAVDNQPQVPQTVEDAPKKRAANPRTQKHSVSFSFKSKRLCEKWLDNLFMVLYNDLRLYTALKQEIAQYRSAGQGTNALLYRKTGSEWEIYGDLALRLEHKEDAKDAYKLCLEQKYSTKSWLKLLELHAEEGNLNQTLNCVAKLVNVLDRAYVETTYPGAISRSLFRLIRRHGLAKVQYGLMSMNIPQKTFKLVTRYFEYAELFKIEGVNW